MKADNDVNDRDPFTGNKGAELALGKTWRVALFWRGLYQAFAALLW